MKKAIVAILSFVLLVNSADSQALNGTSEKYKLPNGLEVIFMEYGNLPVTSITLYVDAGTKDELPGMQGLADVTASALLDGNAEYSEINQDALMASISSGISSDANANFTTVSGKFINTSIDLGMKLFSAIALKPTFPKEQLSNAISQLITYNKPSKMDIADLAGVYSDYVVFGMNNPLGRQFYPEQLKKINRDSVKLFYDFYYTPKNSKLVVSGKPDKEKVKALIEKYFGPWKAVYGETNSSSYGFGIIKSKNYYFVPKKGATQAGLQWNFMGPKADYKNLQAFLIARTVFNDILFEEIRAKEGKTYGIRLSFDVEANDATYQILTQVRNEVMHGTIVSVDREFKKFVNNGITQKQLDLAKTKSRSRIQAISDPESYVNLFNPLLYPDFEKRKKALKEIDLIDLKTVNNVIKQLFFAGAYNLVIAGDETSLKSQLDMIIGLEKLDLKVIEK